MGAWGHGYFEDDAALDFMADLEESGTPAEIIQRALKNALDADYLESDDGSAAIVAATYIDRQVNGTRFSSGDAEPLLVDSFPDRHPEIDLSVDREMAANALLRVVGDNSELKELWEESGELDKWQSGIMSLQKSLKGS